MKIADIQVKDDGSPPRGASHGTRRGKITVPEMLLIEAAAKAPTGAAAGIPTGEWGQFAPIIFFPWEILTSFLDSITMEPRAPGVSSTLAFVEHERGRGFYE